MADDFDVGHVVYELWSDEDLRWIEIPCPTLELAAFLEAWCEKNASIFRRRPFGRSTRAQERATAVEMSVEENASLRQIALRGTERGLS